MESGGVVQLNNKLGLDIDPRYKRDIDCEINKSTTCLFGATVCELLGLLGVVMIAVYTHTEGYNGGLFMTTVFMVAAAVVFLIVGAKATLSSRKDIGAKAYEEIFRVGGCSIGRTINGEIALFERKGRQVCKVEVHNYEDGKTPVSVTIHSQYVIIVF